MSELIHADLLEKYPVSNIIGYNSRIC